MENRDFRILKKILLEIDILEEMIKGFNLERFMEDEKTKRAVCMTLINIGELVKNLNEDLRESYKDVPWRGIAGMRDVTAHKYQTLKMGDVWTTLQNDISPFKNQLLDIINGKVGKTVEVSKYND